MVGRDSLSRLTEREKVCLRQWLQHKSAKEIAADIGVSHHAVEKRLKMARIKLGASSSLEAARILAETEGYGQTVAHSPDLASSPVAPHSAVNRLAVLGVVFMVLIGAGVLALLVQPAGLSQEAGEPTAGSGGVQVAAPAAAPSAGTEAALRTLVAGLASGSPEYDKLSPAFAEVVRRDLPITHGWFGSLGDLQSVTFRGHAVGGGDVYDLRFANGEVVMSARLDAEGRMMGGILQPVRLPEH
jgi:DNA-binding CsgD family transcriptional regulator